MANQFYVQPATPDISPVLAGFGELVKQTREQRQKVAGQKAFMDAYNSKDPEATAKLFAEHPEMQQAYVNAIGAKNDITKKNLLESTREILANPDRAEEIIQNRINLVNEQGGDPSHTIASLEQLRNDPEGFMQSAEYLYSGLASPQEWEAYKARHGLLGSGSGKIGTYNPRDYTVGSFSKFMRTGDPSVLERYTEKTIDVGGVPHRLVPGTTNEYEPIKTVKEVAGDRALIEKAVTTAREVAKADVEKKTKELGAGQSLDQALDVYKTLKSSDLGRIYGYGESMYPDYLRSEEGVTMQANRDRLIGMLQLAGRGQLKGQGQITEGEQAIVAKAATILSNPNISPDAAQKALDDAMVILYRNAGLEFTTDNASADNQALEWAKANPNDPRAVQILQINGVQ